MTKTYGNPNDSEVYEVRLLIGDTDVTKARLTDEEIIYYLTNEPNVYYAAAEACEAIISQSGSAVTSKKVGDLSLSYSDPINVWKTRAHTLRIQAGKTAIGIAGGQSFTEKLADKQNPDLPASAFVVADDDTPRTPRQDSRWSNQWDTSWEST